MPPANTGNFGKKSDLRIAIEAMEIGDCMNFGKIDKSQWGRITGTAFAVAKDKGFKISSRVVDGEKRICRIS